jgi:uncharacterized Zn finger protein
METIEFYVQGSALEPYRVTFEKNGQHMAAFCTCPAGDSGQVCKHRMSILAGSAEAVSGDNKDEVQTVVAWLRGSDVESAMKSVEQAEVEIEQAKKRLSAAKKQLAATMRK